MPCLNRVRYVNFRYGQNGSMVMRDKTFDLAGESTLFNLVNSGGKTSLIHMMAQAVIPNVSFDKRKLDLYFQGEQHTTHVLVEWLLDGGSGYLLTGFCAKGGHGEVHRWLAYQHHYYYNNSFSLEHIPVVIDDQVSIYDKFSGILRQAKQNGTSLSVYFDDEKNKYMNGLINYGIIAKEWEMHLRINMKETEGLRAYYGKWKTSKELMEYEIIPKIDDKVQAKHPLSDHHACLQKHYSQLRQEPCIRAEITDLHALKPMIEKWCDAAEQLERAEQAQVALDIELARFRLGVTEQANDTESELKEAQEKETSLFTRQRQTEFEMKSLELSNIRAIITEINRLIGVEEVSIQTDEAERTGLKNLRTEALAVDLFRILEDREYDVEKLRTEQHNAALGQEELKEKLIVTSSILASYAQATIKRLDQEIATHKQKMRELEKSIHDAEQGMAIDQQQLQQESSHTEVLKYKIQQFTEGVYGEAENAFSPLEFVDLETAPDIFVAKSDKNLKQLERISKDLNARLNETQNRKEALLIQTTELGKKLQQRQFDYERQMEFCKCHKNAEIDIMARLVGFVADIQDVYNGQANIKMTERQQQYDTLYKNCEDRLRVLWTEQKKLSGNFYVATDQIVILVRELHLIGINEAIAGSEYLLNQPNVETLLALHPELPYAVVVNRHSIKKLQQRSNALGISVPTLLIAREGLGNSASVEPEIFIIALAQDIYAVRPDDFRYYLSREEYNALKTKVQNEIDQMEREKKVCREQQSHISGLIEAVNLHIEKFPQETYLTAQAEARQLEGKINDLAEQICTSKVDIEQLTATISELITSVSDAVIAVNAAAALKTLAERFARAHCANTENKQQLAICEKRLVELQRRLNDDKQHIDRLRNDLRETERLIYNTERLKEEPEDIKEAVMGYYQPIGYDTLAVNPNHLMAEFQGLKTLYEGLVQEADSLARKIMEAERARNKAELEFTALGVSRERCGQLCPQTDYVKEQWQKQIIELTESIHSHENEKLRLTVRLESPHESETKMLRDIRHQFECDPQTEFDDGVTLDSLVESLNRIKDAIVEIGKVLEDCKKRFELLSNIKNNLKDEHLPPVNEPISFAFNDAITLSAKIVKARNDAGLNLVVTRSAVTQALHALSRYERISDSKPVEDLVRNFGSDDAALFSGEVAKKKAQEISMIIQDEVRALELKKAMIDEERNEIIDSLLKWTEFANDEIHELVSCSRIKLQDGRRALVEIRKLDKPNEEQMRERLALFITEIIVKLNENYRADADEAKLTAAIAGYLSAYNILEKVVKVSTAEVMVWLAEINPNASRMVPWEEGQSGGQGLLTAFIMYITLMTYTSKEHGTVNQTKTLFADNPFGVANAEHLLVVLFSILRENRIQLMAYTGIEDKNIYRRFPRIFLLRPVDSANKRYTVLQAEQIKSGSGHITLQEAVVKRGEQMNYSLFDEE